MWICNVTDGRHVVSGERGCNSGDGVSGMRMVVMGSLLLGDAALTAIRWGRRGDGCASEGGYGGVGWADVVEVRLVRVGMGRRGIGEQGRSRLGGC